MSKMVDRVAIAIAESGPRNSREAVIWLSLTSHSQEHFRRLARDAIRAMRDFDTEDFTLTEAAGIRRLIDDALSDDAGEASGLPPDR